MSDLTRREKRKLESLFDMDSGYVLDFSNRTFSEFIYDVTNIEIYDEKYNYASGSKANRLRAFWDLEPNHLVGQVTEEMIEHLNTIKLTGGYLSQGESNELIEECLKIATRLKQDQPVENIDAIKAISDDKDFNALSNQLRESIRKNELESSLDRLHTFLIKYIRQLCTSHDIDFEKDHPLHSLFGGYIKFLNKEEMIESKMTEKILKSSISVMEAFNDVRNNQSFAHDNPVLNFDECMLIFNDIANVIKFIERIEQKFRHKQHQINNSELNSSDDLPF